MTATYVDKLTPAIRKEIGRMLIEETPFGPAIDTHYTEVLDLLMRIPPDVALSVAGRDLDLNETNMCLLGWTVREHFAKVAGIDPEQFDIADGNFRGDDESEEFLASIPTAKLTTSEKNAIQQLKYGNSLPPAEVCANLYGGDDELWDAIYYGVTGDAQEDFPWITLHPIESCWVTRINIAASYNV